MEFKALSPNVAVKDVREAIKFYEDYLGFKVVMSAPENVAADMPIVWAMVNNGNVNMMFQEEKNLKEECPCLADQQIGGCFNLYVQVENMKEIYEKVKGTKYVAMEPYTTFYGSEEFAMYDNNGYVITIAEYK